MNTATIKNLSADPKAALHPARAGGPTSERGKLRSALNATKHGLSGKHLLLPGEDPDDYAAKVDGIFTSLAPTNEAEAQIVALVADDTFKLHRLEKIETGISVGRIEQLLAQTGAAGKTAKTARVLNALGTALLGWEKGPLPTERDDNFERRLKELVAALAVVSENMDRVPADLMGACEEAIFRLAAKRTQAETIFSPLSYQRVGDAAGKMMGWLIGEGDRDEAAQEDLRKAIAGIALPEEAELRKVARYRKLLEDSLQRRLHVLKLMRDLTAGKQTGDQVDERARAFRVQLRLVR